MSKKLLSRLDSGEKGRIIKIRGEAGVHRYLFELGLFVGRHISIERINLVPLEDSIKVRVNGSIFSLEKALANNIHVEIS